MNLDISLRRPDAPNKSLEEHLIVGAGPVGLALAIELLLQGRRVHVVDRGSALGTVMFPEASFNLTLTTRSVNFIESLGVPLNPILAPIFGRQIHTNRRTYFHRYGLKSTDLLYSVPRTQLVNQLKRRAIELGVTLTMGLNLESLDPKRGIALLRNAKDNLRKIHAKHIYIADGANSRGRDDVCRSADISAWRKTDGFAYVTLQLPAAAATRAGLRVDRIHFCGSKGAIDIGIGNRDGSMSVLLERRYEPLVSELTDEQKLHLFTTGTPGVIRQYVPRLMEQIVSSPVRRFKYAGQSIRMFGRTVLIGDAGATFPPYLGQGVNAGLHDVVSLSRSLANANGDWHAARNEYESDRNTHAAKLERLANHHGKQLFQGSFGSPLWRFRDKTARYLENWFQYRTLYQRIVFDTVLPLGNANYRVRPQSSGKRAHTWVKLTSRSEQNQPRKHSRQPR